MLLRIQHLNYIKVDIWITLPTKGRGPGDQGAAAGKPLEDDLEGWFLSIQQPYDRAADAAVA